MLTDQKRVAYLPSYDCETVLGCFVKAGYEIHYYDFDKNLSPVFEEEMIPQISVLLVCGYYGYPTYDENFVKKCKASGVSVIVDTTHTAFSPLPAVRILTILPSVSENGWVLPPVVLPTKLKGHLWRKTYSYQ